MSNTENLGLKIPTLAEKNIHTTYVNNNSIIDEAYGQYLEDAETAQENIAMIESSTAKSNHAIGTYFMLDNVLHKATSAIASGETIVSGSNATPITLAEVLTSLNTDITEALINANSMATSARTIASSAKTTASTANINANTAITRLDNCTVGYTLVDTLSGVTQLTHAGLYHFNSCNNICSEFTDYGTGDFMGLLMSNNFYANNAGCRYGTLIMTSPRWGYRIWIIRIWDGAFNSAKMLGS